MFNFLRKWHIVIVFYHWLYCFTFSPAVLKSFNFSALHLHLLFSVFFIIAILIFVKWYFVVLICIFQVTNAIEYLFMCVLPFVYLWGNSHLLIVFICSCFVALYIFWILIPHQIHDLEVLSPIL